MKLEFDEFKNRESSTRTKVLTDDEFLTILKKNCKNFSFDNDQLWRRTNNFGKLGLFLEADRRGTIGNYNYKDFFEERRGYLVPRYKSLIGSTTKEGSDYFGSGNKTYLVIPFDGANLIFAGSADLGLWAKVNQKFTDNLFILKEYSNGFKAPLVELDSIFNRSKASHVASKLKEMNLGFEFFTNSNCLLLEQSKIDWLKSNI